jgi:hypothetical protein
LNPFVRKAVLKVQNHFNEFDSSILNAKESTLNQPPIFVVGAPRVGSTLLFQILVHQFEVAYISNIMAAIPSHMLKLCRLFPQVADSTPGEIRESDLGYVPGLRGPNEAGAIYRKWFESENTEQHKRLVRSTVSKISEVTGKPLLSKNQFNSLRIDSIYRILPESHYIFLVRDPIMVAQSLLIAREKEYGDMNHWWSLKPPNWQSIVNKAPAYQVIWQVLSTNSFVRKKIEEYQLRYSNINYYDLCTKPESIVKQLGNEIAGITPRKDRPNLAPLEVSQKQKVSAPLWRELSDAYSDLSKDSFYLKDKYLPTGGPNYER